jgi:hypothetical protein
MNMTKIIFQFLKPEEIVMKSELKSLWKNLDEDEKLKWCLDEMVNVGISIDVIN